MHRALLEPSAPQRPAVEQAIRSVFAEEYGARVSALPRTLAALLDSHGAVLSATGLRFEQDGFFSEHYRDEPVERLLSRCAGTAVDRSQVVEIGSMAGFRPATSLILVDMVARRCLDEGVTWAIFTATDRLRALLRRSRIATIDLVAASRDRVPDPDHWGGYYLHDPRVVAVNGGALPRFNAMAESPAKASHA